jgi:hypothetical protein
LEQLEQIAAIDLLGSGMADVRSLLQRLALEPKHRPAVEAKANEYVRVATARLGSGGLGQVKGANGGAPRGS